MLFKGEKRKKDSRGKKEENDSLSSLGKSNEFWFCFSWTLPSRGGERRNWPLDYPDDLSISLVRRVSCNEGRGDSLQILGLRINDSCLA